MGLTSFSSVWKVLFFPKAVYYTIYIISDRPHQLTADQLTEPQTVRGRSSSGPVWPTRRARFISSGATDMSGGPSYRPCERNMPRCCSRTLHRMPTASKHSAAPLVGSDPVSDCSFNAPSRAVLCSVLRLDLFSVPFRSVQRSLISAPLQTVLCSLL